MDLHIRETTLEMLSRLQSRGISVIVLSMTPSDQNLIEGDTLYLKKRRLVSEEDMYQFLYRQP